MKKTIKLIVVLAAVSCTQLAVAREALLEATIKDIKVTSIAPAVQEQLNKANPEERKSLEAAIHTGNLFIPQLFSGNAYDIATINEDWTNEVAPLITATMEKWDQQYTDSGVNTKSIKIGKSDVYTTRLTCPQVSLILIKQDERTTTLYYRTTSVGTMMVFLSDLKDFNLDGAGEIYDVRLDLSRSSALVNEVIPEDKWTTWAYTRPVALMQSLIEEPQLGAISKPVDARTIRKLVAEMTKNYQITIQKIEKSAAQYCK